MLLGALAVAEDHDGGHTSDTELASGEGRLVNVELALKALLLELAPTEPNGVKS